MNRFLCVALFAMLLAPACGGEDRPAALDDEIAGFDDDATGDDRPSRGDDDEAASDDDASEPDAPDASMPHEPEPRADTGAPADADDAGPSAPTNCGALTCRGHGACFVEDGLATCVCDEGYIAVGEDDEFECIVDTSCKRFRLLEDGCRQRINGPPAVATFFALDYCAGTAVLPEDLGDLDEAFEILESDIDITQNPESVAAVIERDVESFVTIAIDVSRSITGVAGDTEKQQALSALISELRTFVDALRAPANQPPVSISVLVFGRFVEEYVPFTTDLDLIDQKLAAIETDPDTVVQFVGGDGTALYDAVSRGIDSVERVQQLRHLVTDAGVLSTGTLVVITDGRDSSNAELDERRIEQTRVNVISISISNEIDDAYLEAIGRDGSFLAPAQDDWAAAFAEIAERVEQYPERTYLLAYCSSATTGNPTVKVRLSGEESQTYAECNFSADAFSTDAADVCDLSLFERTCDAVDCGTIFACGGCASDQCCANGTCQAPGSTELCRDQPALCAPGGQVCTRVAPAPEAEVERFVCEAPLAVDGECKETDDYCAPGEAYCEEVSEDVFQCVPVTLLTGESCGDADDFDKRRCPERNCSQKSENNPSDPYLCRREARIFERCSGNTADADCELGAVCEGQRCAPRHLWSCTSHDDCLSGHCNTNTDLCQVMGQCPFSWDEKVE